MKETLCFPSSSPRSLLAVIRYFLRCHHWSFLRENRACITLRLFMNMSVFIFSSLNKTMQVYPEQAWKGNWLVKRSCFLAIEQIFSADRICLWLLQWSSSMLLRLLVLLLSVRAKRGEDSQSFQLLATLLPIQFTQFLRMLLSSPRSDPWTIERKIRAGGRRMRRLLHYVLLCLVCQLSRSSWNELER